MDHDVELKIAFHLEAAHWMPGFAKGSPNRRIHGHSYMGEAIFRGKIDPSTGVLMDFGDSKRKLEELVSRYDHHLLNEIPGLENPSSENLARKLFEDIQPLMPNIRAVRILRPSIGLSVCYPAECL